MKILLVEDEKGLSEALAYMLNKKNIMVDVAEDGLTGEQMAFSGIYDVIVLDRMLPGQDGLAVLKALRAGQVKTPVIFLTAKDAIASRVEGLEAGADDYLVKPFATEEFIARVRALSRRSENPLTKENIQLGECVLDPLRCEVTYGGQLVKLTLKEAQLLEYFMRNQGLVLSKEQIFDRVWGYDSEVEMNNVEIYVHYLRKKLDVERCGFHIQTIRGIGYSLREGYRVSEG